MPKFSVRPPQPLAALLRRFRRNESGVAAVEFAMVSIPFFAFLFAIIEVAMVFFASQVLETATQDAARLILTGQAQSGSYTQAAFKNAVCARIYGLFDCLNGIYVDVKSYSSFAAVGAITSPVDTCGSPTYNFTYQPGNAGDIVVVRVFYQWPLFVTKLGFNLSDTNSTSCNKKLLSATVAFRSEPYGP